jgi:Ser/Thr protein kinase RdoA (MazF antagonist)
VVFKSTLPTQALHGDVSLSNLLHTPHRLVWNDFEDTFRGPVHWGVASYVISLRTRGASPSSVRRMLDAYGWGDERELEPFIAAHAVYDEIWQVHDRQRRRSRERRTESPARRIAGA